MGGHGNRNSKDVIPRCFMAKTHRDESIQLKQLFCTFYNSTYLPEPVIISFLPITISAAFRENFFSHDH